ncbi:MAG: ferrous iron transport protein B [Magnetococcales bacterium]|nr:ferrous iron transport protein B [Magnetococcales bacterium]
MATEDKRITVALAGNPNCGKTALFNHMTGARQRVGNFSGVTVSRKEGEVRHRGWTIRLMDLPGTYSLSTHTLEEIVCRDYLLDQKPDIILNVLDAGNLDRNLFLTTQLIEIGRPRVHALNMADEARRKGIVIDQPVFSRLLDGPAVATVGRTGEGIPALLDALVDTAEQRFQPRGVAIPYDLHSDCHLEGAIGRVQNQLLGALPSDVDPDQTRWLAIKLLEGDEETVRRTTDQAELIRLVQRERDTLARDHGEPVEILLANGRYGFIHGLLEETVTQAADPANRFNITRLIDRVVLNRAVGLPLFLGFMWIMFETTFTLGAYPMDWIDAGVLWLSGFLQGALPAGLATDLLVEGIVGGVGGVIIFLPNIIILFLFISFFEDTGYMARVAFLMDRFMHGIGLHGKAFIPMLMGFGCSVPAIMATRTMENPRDRLVTILVNPFMSCSARLPVYLLIIGAFFQERAGTVLFGLYLLGILTAMLAAVMLKKTLFRGLTEAFVMELPPYRVPTARAVILHMWEKAVEFLKKMGGVILVGSILIWFLQSFPRDVTLSVDYAGQLATLEEMADTPEREQAILDLTNRQAAEEQEKRLLGIIGQAIQPFFAPLDLDWRASIALLTGFVAKEVVVSTLGVLYTVGEEQDESSVGLREKLAGAMSPAVALGFLVFTLLYVPCLATIAAIRRETVSWRWPLFSVGFSTAVAWLFAFVTVHIGGLIL